MLVLLEKLCLSLLLILGAVEAIRMLLRALLRTKRAGKIYLLLTFRGHGGEAELALRDAVQKLKWLGGREEKQILCLDCGMDEETREVCERMAEQYGIIEIRDAAKNGEVRFANP